MARRAAHTPEELRQRTLDAAKAIIERDGVMGISAREIARAIGYSPGTLYNIFENLDDILLTLQIGMVHAVRERLDALKPAPTPEETIELYARTYLEFAIENRLMWNLLLTHVPQNRIVPQKLPDQVNMVNALVQHQVSLMKPNASRSEITVMSNALWAAVHGLTSVAVAEKGPSVNAATAHVFVKQLVTTYLRGLKSG